MSKLIDLKAEILGLLKENPYRSFNQILKHTKVPAGYILDAIADMPEVSECGKYYNSDSESILSYYTVDADPARWVDVLKKKQQLRQIGLLVVALNSEIKSHSGVTTSVIAAYEYIKVNDIKQDLKYFLLDKAHFLFAYRLALNEISLPQGYTASQYYQERFMKAA